MKKLIICVMVFCLMISAENSAQKSKIQTGITIKPNIKSTAQIIDSLNKEINKAKNDRLKAKLQIQIADNYISISPDSSLILANNALMIAEKFDWDEIRAESYLLIAKVNGKKSNWEDLKLNLDKSLKLFEKIKDEVGIGNCNLCFGNYYLTTKNYQQAGINYSKAIEIFKENKKQNLESGVLINYGKLFKKQNKIDSAIIVLNNALLLAKGNNNYNDQISANIDIGVLYSDLSDYKTSNQYFIDALEIAELIDDLDKQARILNNMGVNFDIQSDYELALEYYGNSLAISEKLGNKRGVALKTGNIGLVHSILSDFKKALDYHERAIKIAEELKDKILLQNNYGNIGIIYEKMGNWETALDYYKKTALLSEDLDDKISQAYVNGNIGILYYTKNDYKNAIEHFTKAIDIGTQISHKLSVASNYTNLGNVYQKLNEPQKALDYYHNGLEIAESIGAHRNVSMCHSAIGTQYYILSKDSINIDDKLKTEYINKAIYYLEKSAQDFRARNELDDLRQTVKTLSDTYKVKGDYKKSLEFYKEEINLKDSIYNIEIKKKIAELESVKNLQLKQKENELLKNDALLKESELNRRNQELFNLSNIRKIQELEIENHHFDFAKKNQELNLLNKEKTIKDLEIKQKDIEAKRKANDILLLNNRIDYQSLVRNFMLVSVVLLSSIVLVLFIFFRRKKKDNILLEDKNLQIVDANIELERLNEDLLQQQNEITNANAILEDQRIELKKYSEGLETIVEERTQELVVAMGEIEKTSKLKTAIIANMNHEIRTPLNFIKGSAAIVRMLSLANNPDEELIDTIDNLNHGVNRLNRTMELFADLSAIKSGNFKPNIEPINLKSILDFHFLTYKKEIAEKGKSIQINFDSSIEDVYIYADESCVHSTIGFIVDNAVKFTSSGYVNINLVESKNNKFIVKIEDSGIGISKEYKTKIFEPFSQEDMSSTRKFEGIGLSLALAHEYANNNNFTIDFESKQGKGTKFILEFDKYDYNNLN